MGKSIKRDSYRKMVTELQNEIGIKKCQLLPFHQFGENKYRLLDKSYDYEDVPSLHKEDLEEYLSVFYKYNINAFF